MHANFDAIKLIRMHAEAFNVNEFMVHLAKEEWFFFCSLPTWAASTRRCSSGGTSFGSPHFQTQTHSQPYQEWQETSKLKARFFKYLLQPFLVME